ncbi:hypothetical protein B0T17DRAFT_71497 [Bombardia bombarda]|uniref:Uncharacterized protein n=1 Tax=Bombardia bombarda TaxID=252184 RepID=A0AA39XMW8_9PEZI|nr:hypothetical protein B0T17DRAFT_71497 [Bombardia bombarda]
MQVLRVFLSPVSLSPVSLSPVSRSTHSAETRPMRLHAEIPRPPPSTLPPPINAAAKFSRRCKHQGGDCYWWLRCLRYDLSGHHHLGKGRDQASQICSINRRKSSMP